MIMRCYQLDIIDDDQKLRLFKGRSARGWTKGEPYDNQFPFEEPRLLNRAVNMLIDQNVLSRSELSHTLGLSEYLIESLSGLPKGFFSPKSAESNLVELKALLKESVRKSTSGNGGNVLDFPGNRTK
jgi:hypothetical protein